MNYSLDPIENEAMGKDRARHLLGRTTLGYSRADLDQFSGISINEALNLLLTELPAPDPPLQIFGEDPNVAFGETWVDSTLDGTVRFQRKKSLRSWWIGLLLNQESNIREKMVLFWHNHFVTEVNVVGIPAYLYDYNQLIREHAAGNFKTLASEMTVNTAMLRYLDGIRNTSGSPNENFARELFELFTIGKGPMIQEGNYTFYTEQDVQEGARVLTGWKINNNTLSSYFNASNHDTGDKIFSAYYGNQIISDLGDKEYLALIDMIFNKKQTARALVTKLYRWFVYYQIDEDTRSLVIDPLAEELFTNGYEVKPVLRRLLGSQHFFDANFRGCYIKNPLEFIIGSMRRLETEIPSDLAVSYEHWNLLYLLASYQDLELGTPPDVAGWPAYYLEPQFNELWINSATLPLKAEFSTKLLNGGFKKNGHALDPDLITLAGMTSTPNDPNILITELSDLLLPVAINDSQLDALKGVLIPGLPDFEWTVEWQNYQNNPENTELKESIKRALRALVEEIMHMPEFYLM